MLKRFAWIGLVFALAVLSAAPMSAQGSKQVWAFYFGWWTAQSWGDGRLLDRPAAPYSSLDAGAVGRQIDEARSAGIDAFILSWFGPKNNNMTNQSLSILLDQAAARSFKIGVAVDMHEGGYNASLNEVAESLIDIIGNRANHPAYLRYNGKPVIYFWNQGRFGVGQWEGLRAQLDPNRATIWVAEGTNTSYLPVFDGLYLFNTAWAGDPAATARGWLANTRAAGGTFYTPTALPGWNESNMAGRDNPTSPQDRGGANFLTNSFNGAASAGTDVILIVSWNEYFENSHIEPSQNYGTLALDTLRGLIGGWKSGAPAAAQPVGSAPPIEGGEAASGGGFVLPAPVFVPGTPVPPTGVTFTPSTDLRLRSEPTTNGFVMTTIPAGTELNALKRSLDETWIQVDFDGLIGWLSVEFGTFEGDPAILERVQPPVVSDVPPPSGITYEVNNVVRLRSAPNGDLLADVPTGTRVQVLARLDDSTWVQVRYGEIVGWMSANFGLFSGDLESVPVGEPPADE